MSAACIAGMPEHAAAAAGQGRTRELEERMILLYTLLLIAVGLIGYLVRFRAHALGHKYARVALECDRLANQQLFKEGNSNRFDACKSARRQLELGQLVHKREGLEQKHFKWQLLADKLNRWHTRLRAWKGRKIPYTLGALDVWLVMSVADRMGAADYLNAKTVFDNLVRVFGN